MADDPCSKKPTTAEEVLDHANALFVKARNVALAAAATVLAIGGVAIAIIDQWNAARAHYLERTTADLRNSVAEQKKKADQIDDHLESTDKAVKDNVERLDATPGAPPPDKPAR